MSHVRISHFVLAFSICLDPRPDRGRPERGECIDVVLVVVVVSHIQRIGCQPEKATLHGGQSRLWSAEQGKENKRKKLAAYLPPTPESFNDWGGAGMSQFCPRFGRGRNENSPYRGPI